MPRGPRHLPARDSGFTLIELCAVMAMTGVLAAIAVGGMTSYRDAQAERGTTRELISSLRTAQGRALSEGTTYCVAFGGTSATTWNVYRTPGAGTGVLPAAYSCATGTKVDGPVRVESQTSLAGIAFDQRNGNTTTYVLFYPRGAASPGSLQVGRTGSAKTYSIVVDGLTGRVSSPNGS